MQLLEEKLQILDWFRAFFDTNSFDFQFLNEKWQVLDWFWAIFDQNPRRRRADPGKWQKWRLLMLENADFDEKCVKFFWFLLSLELIHCWQNWIKVRLKARTDRNQKNLTHFSSKSAFSSIKSLPFLPFYRVCPAAAAPFGRRFKHVYRIDNNGTCIQCTWH